MARIRLMFIFSCFLGIFALLASGCKPPATPVPSNISATISAGQASYSTGDPLMLRFTLKNISNQALTLLKWNTPLDGFYSDMFRVEANGQPVEYVGILAYRTPPTAEDFVQLQPGQEISVDFDLAGQYAMYTAGAYTIQYQALLAGGTAQSAQVLALAAMDQGLPKQAITSNTLAIELPEGQRPPPQPIELPRYHNCDETEKNTLFDILPSAERISVGAHTTLETLALSERPHAERYLTWFVAYSAVNYQTAIERLKSISNAIGHIELDFECDPSDCGQNVVAYVYRGDAYKVYLCQLFWAFPLTGQGSQSGILIHEVSHFSATADTDDNAYCWVQQDCSTLDADDALENADSYRRFCENDPPLQPVGPYQGSIFCQEGERCCQFNSAGDCTRCELTSVDCYADHCEGVFDKFVGCTAKIGDKMVPGYREIRCVDGRIVKGPCYPHIP